jgi:hypothetical protein
MITLHGVEVNLGDKVWDFLDGWSEVTSLVENSLYAIHTTRRSYTSDGKFQRGYLATTLFWNEFEIPEIAFKPFPKLAVDTKVLVWDYEDNGKLLRHFSHFDKKGIINCFDGGSTSFGDSNGATTRWREWELYKEEIND